MVDLDIMPFGIVVDVDKTPIKKTETGYTSTLKVHIPGPDELKQRILDLSNKINAWNLSYYNDNAPIVPDAEYDEAKRALKALEEQYPEFKVPGSPTDKVGAPPAGFSKRKHRTRMGSLDNVFNEKELDDWVSKIAKFLGKTQAEVYKLSWSLEPKIDGLSISLTYEDGRFKWGVTRGDGDDGEIVTENCRAVPVIPTQFDASGTLEVRGEVYMPRDEFFELNRRREELGERPFATPRNAAAGSLRQQNPTVTRSRNLEFFAYAIAYDSTDTCRSQIQAFTLLKKLGFPISDLNSWGNSRERILEYIKNIYALRSSLPYDIDGVVIKLSDYDLHDRLGMSGTCPRWAISWKFPGTEAMTYVRGITLQVGRSGVITPVAELEPVNIGGVMVRRATLHNMDEIKRLDLRIGDNVTVVRSGDVIPKIVRVEPTQMRTASYQMPDVCPSCGTLLEREGPKTFCPNAMGCPAQHVQMLEHFCSRDVMNIIGFGFAVVDDLSCNDIIDSPFSILALGDADVPKIAAIPGYGTTRAKSLVASARHALETITPEKFFMGLGIRHVGKTTATLICLALQEKYDNLTQFIDATPQDRATFLSGIKGVGDETVKYVNAAFTDPHSVERIKQALKIVGLSFIKKRLDRMPISKGVVVFTGTMSSPRNVMKSNAENHGFTVDDSVTKRTTVLVLGESYSQSKLNKALANPSVCKITNETAWNQMLAGK